MTSLTNRRSSQPSSPTRLSPLPEQRPYSPTPSSPSHVSRKSYSTPKSSSGTAVSERSDSGISECSLSVEERKVCLSNGSATPSNGSSSLTGTSSLLSPTSQPKGVDWQSSIDSAVSDDMDKSGDRTLRKLSRDALLKSGHPTGTMQSHSRV